MMVIRIGESILLILAVLAFSSCAKRQFRSINYLAGLELSEKEQLLVGKNWNEISVKVVPHNTDSADGKEISGQFLSTDRDDVLRFYGNGTFHAGEGETRRFEDSMQVFEKGKWRISNDELQLLVGESKTSYFVERLTADMMKLKLIVDNEDYHYLLTYTSK
ncbi:MAG: hypothetical protein AAFQ94_12120 [Bacteroidota bacterium]